MKLFSYEAEAKLGVIVLAAYVVAQLHYDDTFTFPALTRETSPGGFWFSVILFSLLSLFLLVFSFLSKKKRKKFNKLVNDADVKDIAGNSTKQDATKKI